MKEKEFLQTLQTRAQEQATLTKELPLPKLFSFIGIWLGNHPWRILIPFAFLITLLLHFIFKNNYDTFVLKVFGGFGIFNRV